jgi:hydrogenase nickel incorporation protein HypB
VMILTKIDLLPYINFDIQKCIEYALEVNPQIQIFQVSAVTGEGLDNWYKWVFNSYTDSKNHCNT